jgi:hypothetical protein
MGRWDLEPGFPFVFNNKPSRQAIRRSSGEHTGMSHPGAPRKFAAGTDTLLSFPANSRAWWIKNLFHRNAFGEVSGPVS